MAKPVSCVSSGNVIALPDAPVRRASALSALQVMLSRGAFAFRASSASMTPRLSAEFPLRPKDITSGQRPSSIPGFATRSVEGTERRDNVPALPSPAAIASPIKAEVPAPESQISWAPDFAIHDLSRGTSASSQCAHSRQIRGCAVSSAQVADVRWSFTILSLCRLRVRIQGSRPCGRRRNASRSTP